MLGKKMQDAINEQINKELYSAYLYLSMGAWAEAQNLPGFAHWMHEQFEEETAHAQKFFDYIVDRGGRVTLKAIEAPEAEFKSPLAMFEKVLAHEQLVTSLIHNLYARAVKENDYPSQVLLQWYINEQVEEEKHATYIVDTLKAVGEKGQALVMMDRELAKREK
jgi:ferritin